MNIAARQPIAVRELRQAARQRRVPVLLGTLAICVPLLQLVIASAMSSSSTPDAIGTAAFETFFVAATCVVVIVGATVAASGVASEREGHTWEALLLSGLRPGAMARGKFLSAFAQAALYLLALAPSAALGFLFGGVTLAELGVAFVLLALVAALAVAFGLAVSSYAQTARGALAGALIATLVVGPTMYSMFAGAGLVVREILREESVRGSTWLAHAIATAPLGARSLLFFVLDPLLVLVVPGWFLFEVTRANLSDPSDDRSTGVRRWYVAATALLATGAIATLLAVEDRSREALAVGLLFLLSLHLGFSSLVFGAEPRGPSRRVEAQWARIGGATLWRRLLGPGIASATMLHAATGTIALAAVYLVGRRLTVDHRPFLALAVGYAIGFHLFVAGVTGVLAARVQRTLVVRGGVVAGALALAVLPLVAGAVLQVVSANESWRQIEAVSPLFLLTAGFSPRDAAMLSARLAGGGYALLGLALVALTVRARRMP